MAASRVTLPELFYDITSSMMLRQPEPEYAGAKLLFAGAARAELAKLDPGALFGSRGPIASGAAVPSFDDQALKLAQSSLAEAIAVVPECAQHGIGHTIRINRPKFANTTYTEASRAVTQSTSISTTPVDVQAEQVSITVRRFAGPYDSTNSRVAPFAIDRFDAGRSVQDLSGYVGLQLSRDRMRFLDTVVMTYLNLATTNIVRAGNVSANTSFPASGEQPLDLETLLRAKESLKKSNIPQFAGGYYLSILHPTQMRQLVLDPDWRTYSAMHEGGNPLFDGSVKQFGDIAIAESNTVSTDTASVANQTIYQGVMMGPGAMGYGIDGVCRTASANEDNYGETAKVIWLAYEGFQLLDERFLCSIRSV